jgi:large subunit ribosomal protein L25
VSTRPLVTAEAREVVGKSVSSLRRQGLLPAVVYGHGKASTPIQLDARAFDEMLRHVTRNQLVDLKIGSGRATPVLLQGIHEHPVRRHPLHVDFYVVKMTEELTVDVPVVHLGESHAAEKMGGTLLHLREHVSVRALPADLPHTLELDITSLRDFDAVLHVRDIVAPAGVTILTDPDEPLARVQAPRVEEELVSVAEEGEAAEGAEPAATETGEGSVETAEEG